MLATQSKGANQCVRERQRRQSAVDTEIAPFGRAFRCIPVIRCILNRPMFAVLSPSATINIISTMSILSAVPVIIESTHVTLDCLLYIR